MKDYIVSNNKQLVGISTSLCRTKINNQNKAKIEAIFKEMSNTIPPLSGLDDELATAATTNIAKNEKEDFDLTAETNYGQDEQHESAKLKEELNLNNSTTTKSVNKSSLISKNPLIRHSLVNYNYNTNSDQELLDEVSDESDQSTITAKLNNQLNKSDKLAATTTASSLFKPLTLDHQSPIIKRNLQDEQPQDENYNYNLNEIEQQQQQLSDDSLRKKKKRKSDADSIDEKKSIVNNIDRLKEYLINSNENSNSSSKKKDNLKEEGEESSASSSDSDSSSSSSSNSSSSDEGGLSDGNESVISNSIINKEQTTKSTPVNEISELNLNQNNSSNKNSSSSNLKETINNSTTQHQPQRSWALSSFYNKLNTNDKFTNLKSPPVTKAQLKQTTIPTVTTNQTSNNLENNNQDKIKNSIDSVVKSSEQQQGSANSNHHYYDSDNSSSSASSSSNISYKRKYHNNNNNSNSKSLKQDKKQENKRQKRSHSPQLSDNDQPIKKSNKKSSSSSIKSSKDKKESDKHEKKANDNKYSPLPDQQQIKEKHRSGNNSSSSTATTTIKKENNKSSSSKHATKELPKNLFVSIDLSKLEKDNNKKSSSSISKNEQDKKSSSKENNSNVKESKSKRDTDYKDKYRNSIEKSDKYDKKSSKDKYEKYDKYDRAERTDKYEKLDKEKEKFDKEKEKFKKSKNQDQEEKLNKESSCSNKKSKSTKEDNLLDKKDKKESSSSKHKKSKKESTKKEDKPDSMKNKADKDNKLKESIKNELFERASSSSKTIEIDKSKEKDRESIKSTKSDSSKDNNKNGISNSGNSKQDLPNQASTSSNKETKEPDYQHEGKKWKHSADREKDPIKQFCQYFESSIYFIQSARYFERGETSFDKIHRLYSDTLRFIRPALQNRFAKAKTHSLDENKLSALGLKCLSLTLFHVNKIMLKEMRVNEKHIRHQVSSATSINSADPARPDQPIIINNKIQMPLQLYTLMKKQLDYLSAYNESIELWQQADHLMENDVNSSDLKGYFKKLNSECGQLSLNSSIDDLVPYARNGLKFLNVDYN